jgi:hypothetical protein
MIVFLDTTFCSSANCTGACGRQWTPELAAKAKAWWGTNEPPVAFSPFCGGDGRTEPLAPATGEAQLVTVHAEAQQ